MVGGLSKIGSLRLYCVVGGLKKVVVNLMVGLCGWWTEENWLSKVRLCAWWTEQNWLSKVRLCGWWTEESSSLYPVLNNESNPKYRKLNPQKKNAQANKGAKAADTSDEKW